MTISPFAPGAYGARLNSDRFVSMRSQLDDLQRQLATGQRADSYGGLGSGRRTSLDVRGRLSAIEGYKTTIESADFRLKMMMQGLERIDTAARKNKEAMVLPHFEPGADGKTVPQRTAEQNLKMAIEALNEDIEGRYLFAGRAVDQAPVESFDRIMNGDANSVGLRQYIAERVAIEAGPLGDGRVAVGGAGNTVTLGRTDATAYGISILGISSSGAGVTATAPAGSPPAGSVGFTAPVAEGARVDIEIGFPDGTTQTLQFTAKAAAPLGPNEFLADPADPTVPAASLRAQLAARMTDQVSQLNAVSSVEAAKAFFAGSPSAPPPGITDPRPVVIWYRGDDTAPSARETVPVSIDGQRTVATGAAAIEPGIQSVLAGFGALAAQTFTNTTAERFRYESLTERVTGLLTPPASAPSVKNIAIELGQSAEALKTAKDVHQASANLYQDALAGIEQAPPEEVAAALLTLQNRLQASYQATATLSRLSLVNYL